MEPLILNDVKEDLSERRQSLWTGVLLLPARMILFALCQVLSVYVIGLSWAESIAWWPFYAIFTNIVMVFLLSHFAKKEGLSFLNLLYVKNLKRDFKKVLWVFPVGAGIGFFGMYVVSFLMYDQLALPDNMILPLPAWAAIIAIILFPMTNALVETPSYMGYCFPRIEQLFHSKWIALVLSALFLALQHVTLPILAGDEKYMLWHFLSFLPLAFVVGYIFLKIRTLIPIIVVHYVMDVMAVVGVLVLSL